MSKYLFASTCEDFLNYQQKRKGEIAKDGTGIENEEGQMMSNPNPPNPVVLSKSAPQNLQNEQASNARLARTRYAGGGFAIK